MEALLISSVIIIVNLTSSGSLKVRPGLAYLKYWSQGQAIMDDGAVTSVETSRSAIAAQGRDAELDAQCAQSSAILFIDDVFAEEKKRRIKSMNAASQRLRRKEVKRLKEEKAEAEDGACLEEVGENVFGFGDDVFS
mmetsp:Transcript_65530/g.128625  ORF Transcript_65530/g.128625 Transcript_65530/m.128625 type:complete len:137 (-) Transcript_65530:116-526(-)